MLRERERAAPQKRRAWEGGAASTHRLLRAPQNPRNPAGCPPLHPRPVPAAGPSLRAGQPPAPFRSAPGSSGTPRAASPRPKAAPSPGKSPSPAGSAARSRGRADPAPAVPGPHRRPSTAMQQPCPARGSRTAGSPRPLWGLLPHPPVRPKLQHRPGGPSRLSARSRPPASPPRRARRAPATTGVQRGQLGQRGRGRWPRALPGPRRPCQPPAPRGTGAAELPGLGDARGGSGSGSRGWAAPGVRQHRGKATAGTNSSRSRLRRGEAKGSAARPPPPAQVRGREVPGAGEGRHGRLGGIRGFRDTREGWGGGPGPPPSPAGQREGCLSQRGKQPSRAELSSVAALDSVAASLPPACVPKASPSVPKASLGVPKPSLGV